MKEFKFKGLLVNKIWQENVSIMIDNDGVIQSIKNSNDGLGYSDFAIPGFQNAHSHSFQYAMAGLAELHDTKPNQNDFWSWRNAMYDLALTINPDQLEDIATMLYKEMLRNGYTHVAEFHYLHHDISGNKFNNISENGERLVSAAKKAGIKITLIPIFYQMGGFGKKPEEKQRRFISANYIDYVNLLDASKKSANRYSNASTGIGIHSMRGVTEKDIIHLSEYRRNNTPFHIHVSEQLKEIEDCINHLGQRPVEWLANNIELNENYHLVHATHINKKEISKIAKSKANVVLCPSTEGNLGDGIFPLKEFLSENGRWSIGTDSHIGLNPLEEIRLLDYGQRLITHNRNTFGNNISGDNGSIAIESSFINGKKSMGEDQDVFFQIGQKFDALVINESHPLINQTSFKNLSNTIVYSSDISSYKGTIVNGDWVIIEGKHKDENIEANFRSTLKTLSKR